MSPRQQAATAESRARETKQDVNSALRRELAVEFGREICEDLPAVEKPEWIVTNGIGGFASGTVAGMPTRRYHGFLVAALKPPVGRTLLVSHLEETAECDWTQVRSEHVPLGGWRRLAQRVSAYRKISFGRHNASVDVRLWRRAD